MAAGVAVLAVLVGGGAWLAHAEDGKLPPDVEIGGVEVGERTRAEARDLLERAAESLSDQPIVLVFDGERIETSGAELGVSPAIDEVLERAEGSRGPFSRLKARLGLSDTVVFPLEFSADRQRLEALLDDVERRMERRMAPAGVRIVGDEVVVVPSQAGRELDRGALRERLALLPESVEVPLREVAPSITNEAAEVAKATADALLGHPPEVVFGRTRVELEPQLVLAALRFEPGAGAIAVALEPRPLEERLEQALRRHEREPRDASFRVTKKGRVRVIPARAGRELAVDRIAAALLEHAGSPAVRALFDRIEPELTTTEAEALGIRELVSEFTTPYSCCQPRVTNIQLAAEILDGTVIPPSGRFSLNEALGERTAQRGFVLAPMIEAGRLVDAIGGGVSQVATTFYNAAFFAGLELIEHTPHQFYISRYPMGREATVSWGGPELVFRNDWPVAILVKVEAGDTSITVRLYSSKLGRRVETETGAPYDPEPARVIKVKSKELPPGTKKVVQHGGVPGFSVNYTRRVYRGERLIKDERYHVEYDPEDTIVEVGPKKKKPTEPAEGQAGPVEGQPPAEGEQPPAEGEQPPEPPPELPPPAAPPVEGSPGETTAPPAAGQ